jgi:hypothetical protein
MAKCYFIDKLLRHCFENVHYVTLDTIRTLECSRLLNKQLPLFGNPFKGH